MALKKYEDILLNNNYTIVIVEHITSPPNPERGVTRIVSPGTSIENYNKSDNNFLMSIFIENYKGVHSVGVASIDLSRGKNYLHSMISKIEDKNYLDEIGRFIHFYNPSEIIFHTKNITLEKEDIIQKWDISHQSIQCNHYKEDKYFKLSYQNEFLQHIFKIESQVSVIEELDLERNPELIVSYIYLLQYIHDHRVDILSNIEKPEIVYDTNYLSLTSDSIRQLNVINNYSYFKGKNESLLSVTNVCVSPMGRRLCKERLLYPSVSKDIINQRYDSIDFFKENNFYETIHNDLKKVSDLEKSLRKMGLGLLTPFEFFSDSLSFDYVYNVIQKLDTYSYKEKTKIHSTFTTFYNEINHLFNFQNFTLHGNIEKSIFNKNIYEDLDTYDTLTDEYCEIMMCIIKRLSKLIDNKTSLSVKYDYDDRNGWHIYCTNKRSKTLQEKLQNMCGQSVIIRNEKNEKILSLVGKDISYKNKDKSSMILSFQYMNEVSKKLSEIQKKVSELNKTYWKETNERLYSCYNGTLKDVYLYLANIDVYCSGAKISIQNKYVRPIIEFQEKSYCDCKDIRHPIVEKIHTTTEYVTNDITLGKDNKDGILLFGTNACGKSTLMKAIGLNIILAQAGFFVACSEFRFHPYTRVFTRILNNDNIFRSQSSFAVEVQELKGIMNHSDSHSLILGDELCSGTESISALSIISSGLYHLCNRKSSFIFTSHLHQLTSLDEIQSLDNLNIYHLKIKYDRVKNILTYDRKLTEGSGPSIYGLQVCEAMGMSRDFISYAKKVQNKLENNQICAFKESVYNKDIIMDECKICNSKENLETHHIKDQQYADNNHMIDHHHKNIHHNLVSLCSKCHLQVTLGKIIVKGWIETSKGRQLEWSLSETKEKTTKKQFTEKDIDMIKSFYESNNRLSQKDFIKLLEKQHNIKTSISTWRKIQKGEY